MKKITQAVFSLMLTAAIITGCCSFAVSAEAEYKYGMTASEYASAEQVIITSWDAMSSTIDISKFNISTSVAMDFYLDVVTDNPEYFYVVTSIRYSYNPQTNKIIGMIPEYTCKSYELDALREQFNAAVDTAMKSVNSSMSELDKIVALHDYIVETVDYDIRLYSNVSSVPAESYTSYGALVNGVAVCQGYSMALNVLLSRAGIESNMVSSASMNHAWNTVRYNGKLYHMDATWDDALVTAVSGKSGTQLGGAEHTYLMLNDTEMANARHSGWSSDEACDGASLSGSYYDGISTGIYADGNYQYYVSNDGKIVRRTMSTGAIETLKTLEDGKWGQVGNSYYVFHANDANMIYSGGWIFYTTANSIVKLNPETLETEVVFSTADSSTCISRIAAVDGKLYYDYYGTSWRYSLNNSTDYAITERETEPPVKLGDMNGDGKYNMKDALLMRRYIAGIASDSEIVKANADANSDGKYNMKDVLVVRQLVAGIAA